MSSSSDQQQLYPTRLPVYLTQHLLDEYTNYKYQKEIVQVFVALQMATKAINNEVRSARKFYEQKKKFLNLFKYKLLIIFLVLLDSQMFKEKRLNLWM